MCRACYLSFEESDDPEHACQWVSADEFESLVDIALDYHQMESISQHNSYMKSIQLSLYCFRSSENKKGKKRRCKTTSRKISTCSYKCF
jgi:hypothetical protein